MAVIWLKEITEPLDYYYTLEPNTTIYVFKLKINGGIRLIKEALSNPTIKVYSGQAKRKASNIKWFQHFTTGRSSPDIFYIKLSNGVKFYDYSKFDSSDDPDPEEALSLCKLLINCFDGPISPSAIIRSCVPLLNQVQGKNTYGVQYKATSWEVLRFAHKAFYGGAVYNFRRGYYIIPNETHIDFHQMYAWIMNNKLFPDISKEYTIKEGYYEHPMAIYWIGGGKIRLKSDGFPLLNIPLKEGANLEEIFKNFTTIPWRYLTKIDLDIILENFEVDENHPLEIIETFYYNESVEGNIHFGTFIESIYRKRRTTTGAIKRFYKLLNEYMPGCFERGIEQGKLWQDLEESKPGKIAQLNNIIGVFITAYGRQLLNHLLHLFPYKRVIGYDTDCVFFAGTPEETPEEVKKMMGEGMGQLHYDGIYTNVRHLAIKQYYGYEDGKIFARMAGVPNGLEVATNLIANGDNLTYTAIESITYLWNKEEQEYKLEYMPLKISLNNFKGGLING